MPDLAVAGVGPTLAVALRRVAADLRAAGIDDPAGDARRLAAAALDMSAARMLGHPEHVLSPEQAARLAHLVARRAAREPVSRILGEREFYGRSFVISPATLDPRPDSETLVEAALALVRADGASARPLRILDVGTGSGCLLLSLLAELAHATGVGTDVSEAALGVAAGNADRLGLAARARWRAADMLDGIDGPFDLLISNPPYVAAAEIDALEPEVRCFDPRAALDGGPDGLRFFHQLAPRLGEIVPDGWVVLEVGHDQADAVAALLAAALPLAGASGPRLFRDVAGRRRCVAMRSRN
jgi:release factor glutamine methyltransferase